MITSEFINAENYLAVQMSGAVSQVEIIEYVESLRSNKPEFPSRLYILTDASKAKLDLTHDTLESVMKVVNRHPGLYERVFDAIVFTDPRDTAMGALFEALAQSDRYHIKIFSTIDAAKAWLKSQ